MGAAVDYAAKVGIDWIENRVQNLAKTLRCKLMKVDGVKIWDLGNPEVSSTQCGIVTFNKERTSPAFLKKHLESRNIFMSLTESKANTPIDARKRRIPALCRASVHYYNTEEEINGICSAISGCPQDL